MKFKGQKIYEKQFPTILNNIYGKSGLGKHSIFEKWRDFEKWREEKILQRLWPMVLIGVSSLFFFLIAY